jgi:protein associated with RNAse G/E
MRKGQLHKKWNDKDITTENEKHIIQGDQGRLLYTRVILAE